MGKHQSIQDIRREEGEVKIQISLTEIIANWRCAAKLADLEQLHETADRLRFDADTFNLIEAGATDTSGKVAFVIEVTR